MKPLKIVYEEEIPPLDLTGRPITGIHRRLIDVSDTEVGIIVGVGCLRTGEAVDWHTHPLGEDPALFVLEGRALVEWKEGGEVRSQEIRPTAALYTPAALENRLSNPFEEPVRYVYFVRVADP